MKRKPIKFLMTILECPRGNKVFSTLYYPLLLMVNLWQLKTCLKKYRPSYLRHALIIWFSCILLITLVMPFLMTIVLWGCLLISHSTTDITQWITIQRPRGHICEVMSSCRLSGILCYCTQKIIPDFVVKNLMTNFYETSTNVIKF